MFASMRYRNGRVLKEATLLKRELEQQGFKLYIIDMRSGEDIDAKVFSAIEHCDTFLVFGTHDYGEDTGNSASTYEESKYAKNKGKRIILLRMIPRDKEFTYLQARVIFGKNRMDSTWIEGQPMPTGMVGAILKAIVQEQAESLLTQHQQREPIRLQERNPTFGDVHLRCFTFRRVLHCGALTLALFALPLALFLVISAAKAGSDSLYPNCTVRSPDMIGDGRCDGGDYNTAECGFDGGDCDLFNSFPNCTAAIPFWIGDGYCHGGDYNTAECGFDGGDCVLFNSMYPNCAVEIPWLIGDGNCHGGDYNTAECGFDGGDCDLSKPLP